MIYPQTFPATTNDISSEHHFYRRFQREMNETNNIYYSLTLITPDVPMREIDFVIVNCFGIVTIELKNGRWRVNRGKWDFYNVRERDWQSVEGKAYNGPTEQSLTQRDLLKEFLKNHNGLEDFYPDEYHDAAIFFLKNNRNDFYLKHSHSPWIFGKETLEDESLTLQQIIDRIQDVKNRIPLSDDVMKKVHEVLSKNLNFVTSAFKKSRGTSDQLLSLTKEQFALISEITSLPRAIVYGVPGSGKSILAGRLSFLLVDKGIKVVIWQGSPSLYRLWKEELDSLGDVPKPILIHDIKEVTSHHFDHLIIDQVDEWITEHSLKDLFLYLSESFWKTKNWSIFIKRKLKLIPNPILDFLESTKHRTWDITRNIRNSKEIADFANRMANGDGGQPVLATLMDVQLVAINEGDKLSDKLRWCFGYAKKILGITTDEIKVICPSEMYKTESPDLNIFLKEHSIEFLTFDEFSGMEESCGVLVGFKDWHLTKTRSDVSEAALLFRDLICILYDEKEEFTIQTLLKKSGPGP